MTQSDWAIVLQIFRASRSRRGDKGWDDRKFWKALQYFAVHNITWRALPSKFGNWSSRVETVLAFKPVRNLRSLLRCACGNGTAQLVQMFDSTVVRAHVSAAGAGQSDQARRRIAPRCEKTTRNYASFVALALGFILIKSVHTA